MPSGLLNSLWIVPILGILILVHELGHFVAARLVGIRVEEFGMGLPPRLWGYKAKSGVIYSLNWIPFGGFVKMHGQDDMRVDGGVAEGSDSFTAKTALQRAFVLVAGVVMNLLLAILIFMAIARTARSWCRAWWPIPPPPPPGGCRVTGSSPPPGSR